MRSSKSSSTRRPRRLRSIGTTTSSRRPRSPATAPWFIRASCRKPPREGDAMAELSPQQAADVARAASGLMRQPADAAKEYADAAAAVAYAAPDGAIDPFMFRFSIFVLAIFVGY